MDPDAHSRPKFKKMKQRLHLKDSANDPEEHSDPDDAVKDNHVLVSESPHEDAYIF